MTSPHPSDKESDTLTRKVELFRRHSHRLSQVASHAAQSSADSKRKLKEIVDQMVLCAVVVTMSGCTFHPQC